MSNPLEATQVQSSDGSGGRIPDFLERNISIARVFLGWGQLISNPQQFVLLGIYSLEI